MCFPHNVRELLPRSSSLEGVNKTAGSEESDNYKHIYARSVSTNKKNPRTWYLSDIAWVSIGVAYCVVCSGLEWRKFPRLFSDTDAKYWRVGL